MRRPGRALAVLAGATLLALGPAACGGDGDEPESTSTSSAADVKPAQEGGAGEGGASQEGAARGDGQESEVGESSGGEATTAFKPEPHDDSGGGARQFRSSGGDNSVQRFGAEAEGTEFDQAAAALHAFYDARAAGAWAAACEYLSEGLAGSLEGRSSPEAEPATSCATGLEESTNSAALPQLRKEAQGVDVGSLRADGDTGFLLFTTEGVPHAIAVVKEDDEWKVANLAGLPLA